MHVLLGLLITAFLAYVIYRTLVVRTPSVNVTSAARSEHAFAFLSNGMIFYRERGGEVKQVHSPYAQDAMDRRERSRARHSWKEGTSFNVAASGGHRSFTDAHRPLMATAAAYEPGGDLLYFLEDEHVGGLFRREADSGNELRVVLKQNLHLTDLSPSSDGAMLAASSLQSDGIANIVLMNSDGSDYREVTSGDTVDSSPAWIPGAPKRMVLQSCGFARNEQGYVLAQGNASIQLLDMESGTLSPVLDDPAFDYLKPRVAPSGDLLFIRRPYEGPSYGVSTMLGDFVLFPFRLIRAVFHYLNFFSMMYSRKPLSSANGPAKQADIKSILLQGKRVEVEKALRGARPVHGVPCPSYMGARKT
jgi:hypothetical protein